LDKEAALVNIFKWGIEEPLFMLLLA